MCPSRTPGHSARTHRPEPRARYALAVCALVAMVTVPAYGLFSGLPGATADPNGAGGQASAFAGRPGL